MNKNDTFHYPPELLNLVIDTIPLLNKGKKDVFLFFQGAGVERRNISEIYEQWENDKQGISKYEITRQILTKINEKTDHFLRQRREVLKRVVEYENFATCWPNDQLKAKGLVAEIRKVINVKDTFTRMSQERDKERKARLEQVEAEKKIKEKKNEDIEKVKLDFFRLFHENEPQKRGKALEKVLNRLFDIYGISVREDFTVVGEEGEGIIGGCKINCVNGHRYINLFIERYLLWPRGLFI